MCVCRHMHRPSLETHASPPVYAGPPVQHGHLDGQVGGPAADEVRQGHLLVRRGRVDGVRLDEVVGHAVEVHELRLEVALAHKVEAILMKTTGSCSLSSLSPNESRLVLFSIAPGIAGAAKLSGYALSEKPEISFANNIEKIRDF